MSQWAESVEFNEIGGMGAAFGFVKTNSIAFMWMNTAVDKDISDSDPLVRLADALRFFRCFGWLVELI